MMTEHEPATLETVAGLLEEILQELERVRQSVARVAEGMEMLTERLDGLTKRMQAEMGMTLDALDDGPRRQAERRLTLPPAPVSLQGTWAGSAGLGCGRRLSETFMRGSPPFRARPGTIPQLLRLAGRVRLAPPSPTIGGFSWTLQR